MRVGFGGNTATAQDGDSFAGRVAPRTLGADLIRALWFFALVFEIADQAAAAHPQEEQFLSA